MSESPLRAPSRLTIADVARAAGVSRTTVSHALNDRGQVDPRTRERVKQIAQELGYRPNLRAQRLRTGKANSIALVSSMPFSVAGGPSRLGFMMEVAGSAMEAALRQGLALVLVPPLDAAEALLDELDIDGAVVIEPAAHDRNVTQLQRRGVKVVSIGRQPEGDQALPYIDLQGYETGRILLQHLEEQGALRTALLIGTQPRHSYVDMEQAYRDFVGARDMPVIIARAEEAGGESAGREACRALLESHPGIDAICAPVDAFAVGVVKEVQARGLRVPEDIRVVTRYDGLRARSCQPPLTAVNLHLDEISALAIDLLFEHINGRTQRTVVTGPKPGLVIRASSVSPRGN
ncbi:LacI family DNA-binding transcriptional regulator [Marinobacterium sedimentorum]|uniref:LacI family DNA-binding transcriptional regulator n=1 Tax=Marinobacterium sedimentorum TaxID=2927804 RepID=UPI0020C632EF|nr:LacI family DNA-binding transcriptional regulator [Marinobacterium sedimentorum]MCP8688202.1 LacI family DNA-binding transcriptional regulator [Marinobacterium sedimentorum]